MSIKKYIKPTENKPLAQLISNECNVSNFLASILVNRGHLSTLEAKQFIGEALEISSPFEMRDMTKAVDRIRSAIDNDEKIAVYGDYDCDGITSTCIVYSYLNSIGVDAVYYIPSRDDEGYGLNEDAVKQLFEQDVNLIITVDTGITAITQVEYANSLGIDVVITDHHQPLDILPPAYAVINPHRKDDLSPEKNLCGAGVAFKLLYALEGEYVLNSFIDLVAIATIGDVVAIKGENRAIVQFGLNLIKNTDNMGLRALMEISGINPETITSSQVAFGIVPRINAAGRMGKTQVAINLLLSESENEANQYADELNKLNVMRQQAELDILENIQISKEDLYNRLLVLQGDDWNAGVIGIVCSRLVEKYGKPTFILSGSDELTGSCRSVGGFHIFNALSYCAKYLKKYGGHKAAGGFSLERSDFKRFKNALETYAYENFDIMPCPYIKVDKIITLKELTIDNVKSLELLQPFGCENEEPLFLLENATIEKIVPLSAGKHIKLMLKQAELSVQALYFNMTAENLPAVFGDRVDVLFNASINEYNGEKSVCLKIKDIRRSSFNQDKFFAAKAYFEKIIRQEEIPQNIIKASIPTREEIAVCYRFLLKGFSGSDEILYQKLLDSNINFCKLKIIIEVLTEMELINDDFSVIKTDKKVDLQQSKLLVRLRELI